MRSCTFEKIDFSPAVCLNDVRSAGEAVLFGTSESIVVVYRMLENPGLFLSGICSFGLGDLTSSDALRKCFMHHILPMIQNPFSTRSAKTV